LSGDIQSGSALTFCWMVSIVVWPAELGTTMSITASPNDLAEM